jgi:outer membrane protein assembly factor BamB
MTKTLAGRGGFFLVLLGLTVATARAENWPAFRGPTGQGISAEAGLPLKWSAAEGVAWKTAIPGEGWSSPIVWGERVFLTAALDGGRKCHVLCLDAASGRILWNTEALEQTPGRKEGKNSYATPTPCTDGERVCAVFNDGSVVALDFAGRVLWTNREVSFYSRHGLGASPLLHDGLLIMPYDGSMRVAQPGKYPNNTDEERTGWQIPWDKSFVVALDVQTGRRTWTAKRGMSRIAHVTPNVLRVGGETQVVSCAGNCIQGFHPRTGALLWHCASEGEGVTPSPAIGDGLIYTSSGFVAPTLRTVRAGGQGDITATHVAWEQRKGVPMQASLLYVKPHLYSVTDGGIVTCFQAASGEILYQGRLGGNYCASPVCADGHIYFLSEAGETVVIGLGAEFNVLARNPLGERCQASMAVSGGRLFIRTAQSLHCIGPASAGVR